MAGAAAMPDLQEDAAAGGVHRVGHPLPACHLRLGMDAGLAPERRVAWHGHGGLGDKQAAAGALGVVLGHHRSGHMLGVGTAARERRHENAVGYGQCPEFERAE